MSFHRKVYFKLPTLQKKKSNNSHQAYLTETLLEELIKYCQGIQNAHLEQCQAAELSEMVKCYISLLPNIVNINQYS